MKKKLSKKALHKELAKQLRYLRRNLEHIARLSGSVPLTVLSVRWHRDLLVIGELYRQQLGMWQSGKKSISLPERMSWNAYNEGCDLVRYIERYGHYPESVHADKIYRTQANLRWYKEREIRLSSVPLGRPPKDIEKNRARRRQIREDEGIRTMRLKVNLVRPNGDIV